MPTNFQPGTVRGEFAGPPPVRRGGGSPGLQPAAGMRETVPELPEVETMRRIIERELLGLRLDVIELRLPKLLRGSPLPSLDPLLGQHPIAARRRAKVLITDWSEGLTLLAHFKLAGQLAVDHPDGARHVAGHPVPQPTGPYPHKSTHVILTFEDGTRLFHSDVRQFGWLRLLPSDDVAAAIADFGFGPEAVGLDAITVAQLEERLRRRRAPLKLVLLDQTVLAGLGNIYVDEALHRARLHPARPANSLPSAAVARLHEAIAWALSRGIEQGGATIIHNRAYPRDGFPTVHALAAAPCQRCGTPIVKIRVGARGTYLCPTCQPEPCP